MAFTRLFTLLTFALLSGSALAASILATYGQWSYLDCYQDGSPRRLHHAAGSLPDQTVETCLDACNAGGFALGGLEYGSECYCGNSILYDYGFSQSCDMSCAGNVDEICGGPSAMIIYHYGDRFFQIGPASILPSYGDWVVTDCWQDDTWPRVLPNWPTVPIPTEEMTVERCIDGCAASGYTSAGVEYGQECWCGTVTYPIGTADPGSCNMPCLGNAAEICGDAARLLAYTKP